MNLSDKSASMSHQSAGDNLPENRPNWAVEHVEKLWRNHLGKHPVDDTDAEKIDIVDEQIEVLHRPTWLRFCLIRSKVYARSNLGHRAERINTVDRSNVRLRFVVSLFRQVSKGITVIPIFLILKVSDECRSEEGECKAHLMIERFDEEVPN